MHNLAELTTTGSITLGCAVLAEGTNAATIKTTAAVDFMINQLTYTKAATDNIAVTACAVQADLTTCMYLISIDSAGTVTTTKARSRKPALICRCCGLRFRRTRQCWGLSR